LAPVSVRMKKMRPSRISLQEREIRKFRLMMLAPGLIVLFAINFLPILDTFRTSLLDFYLPQPNAKEFIGLANYVNLFKDPRFIDAFKRTVVFVTMVVSMEVLIGFSIALALSSNLFGTKIVRATILLPIMMTPITTAFMWRIMYSPSLGVFNYFLEVLRIPPQKWIYGAEQAIPSIAAVLIWCKTPFMIMVFFTGLLSVSQDVIEASKIDGASAWQTLWKIKLPLIRPVFFVAILFQMIDTLKEFDFTQILTRGGPGSASETMSIYAYLNSFGFLKMGYGSANAIVLSLLIGAFAVIVVRLGGISFDQ
jgi:multiple sugar transport system permease protein